MPRRIRAVDADPKTQTLTISWANRATTTLDVRPLIRRRAAFRPLGDRRLFGRARVVAGGHGIDWPGTEADCAADWLWYQAHPADNAFSDAVMPANDFRRWMAQCGLTLSTAARALGMGRRRIAYYASGERRIPKVVFLACMTIAQSLHGRTATRKAA